MAEFLQGLLRTDFLPHGWCYRWQPEVVWLHVVSDLLIAAAYYSIPASLVYIVRRRGDLVYPWMFWLFGLFILACGTTHLLSVVVVWYPWYRFDGMVKAITGIVSLATAILMARISPAVVALPSPEDLRRVNRQLTQEVVDRRAAEDEVRKLNADLERRVQERTSELEIANLKLRESENRLRAILDGSPTIVYMKDLGGKYLFVNRRFEETFGIPRSEILRKTDDDVFPREVSDFYRRADREVLERKGPMEVEETALQGTELRTYMSVKFPLEDESGQTYALCGISADITERKKAEKELRQYNADLEQFAFVVSHDLQEPLRTVKSFTQLFARRYRTSLDQDADELMSYITGGVDRMHALIADLQSYAELGKIRQVVTQADAGAVLRDTLRHMDSTIRESKAVITYGELPRVAIHPAQLGQVFQNVVSNAIKYSKPGEPAEIEIRAVRDGRAWEFTIKDNGIGLDMKYADQIFGVFRRLHGRDVPGTGIGLAICKKIVESHGGTIWVVSEPERGSEFHFTLPA
jgi:PAS domain S-box-containing protein